MTSFAKLRATRPTAPALALMKRLVAAAIGGYGGLPIGRRVAPLATDAALMRLKSAARAAVQ